MEQTTDRLWTLVRQPTGPLVPYLELFAHLLVEQGFKQKDLGRHIRVAAQFSRWLASRRVVVEAVTDDHLTRFQQTHWMRRAARQGGVAALRRLVVLLRRDGVIPTPTARIHRTPIQEVVELFGRYLREERELSERTLVQYCPFAESFLFECFGNRVIDLASLRAQDVIGCITRHAAHLSPCRAKAATIALRAFLRYARFKGEIRIDLASAVPTVPNWSMTGIPRAIAPDHVRAALAHCELDTPAGSRDYAILLLLARLGLRSGEIVSLTLDSIDWERGSIAIVGKGGQAADLPLPAEVGEAIARYLRQARPPCIARQVFLRVNAPIRGLGSYTTISTIVNAALTRARIETPHRGAHQFRHALAAEMLRGGATLTEIGTVLRHRRAKTTAIYAKVDFAALRPLGLPWPGAAS